MSNLSPTTIAADLKDETDPVERLRYFCSCSMDGDHWLGVEPYFDAVSAELNRLRAALEADLVQFRQIATNTSKTDHDTADRATNCARIVSDALARHSVPTDVGRTKS